MRLNFICIFNLAVVITQLPWACVWKKRSAVVPYCVKNLNFFSGSSKENTPPKQDIGHVFSTEGAIVPTTWATP